MQPRGEKYNGGETNYDMAAVANQASGSEGAACRIRLAPQEIWIMTDPLSQVERSANMRAIKSRDTEPEKIVRSIAHRMGYRFRLCVADLPGKPDIVFPRLHAAIFVHGCFWHGHQCKRGAQVPQTHTAFWKDKIARNVARDRKQTRTLREYGWRVMTVWQCQIRKQEHLISRLRHFLADSIRAPNPLRERARNRSSNYRR